MASDSSFAPPLSELATSNLGPPGVAVTSSGGQGFSLDGRASVPVTSQGGNWRMEYVTASVNIGSIGAQSVASTTVTIPGLVVGDLCFFIGGPAGSPDNRSFIKSTNPLCSTAGQITLLSFNADDVTVDPSEVTFHFLVIHRFL